VTEEVLAYAWAEVGKGITVVGIVWVEGCGGADRPVGLGKREFWEG